MGEHSGFFELFLYLTSGDGIGVFIGHQENPMIAFQDAGDFLQCIF